MSWKAIVGLSLSAMLLLLMSLGQLVDKDLPIGQSGEKAEALADQIEASINKAAWLETGIVLWTFAGGEHIWDRSRELHEYKRGGKRIQHSLRSREGRIYKGDDWESIKAGSRAEQKAWDSWINDSFWLNPLVKLRDEGVSRQAVGDHQLLVSYSSGGNTPGDAYLWTLDERGRPSHWNMWVSIIPIGGLGCTWDNWIQLRTGAWISTAHNWGGLTLTLDDVDGAAHWSDIFEADPFLGFLSE